MAIKNFIPHYCTDKKTIEKEFRNADNLYVTQFFCVFECSKNQLGKKIDDKKTLIILRIDSVPNIPSIMRIIRLLPITITRFEYHDDVDEVHFFEIVDKIFPIFKKQCPFVKHVSLVFGNSGYPVLKPAQICSALNYYKGLISLTISSTTRDNTSKNFLHYEAYDELFVFGENFKISPPNSLDLCEGFGPVQEIVIGSCRLISDEKLGQYVKKCRQILKRIAVRLTKCDFILGSLADCSNLENVYFDCAQATINPVNFLLFIDQSNLVNLELENLSLSTGDLVRAFSCDGFKTIEMLSFIHCQNITDLVLLAISLAAKKLKNLTLIGSYGHTRITDYGVAKLLRFCNYLTSLSLIKQQGIEGYFTISIETAAPQLEFLNVEKCSITRPIYKSNLQKFAKNFYIDIIGID